MMRGVANNIFAVQHICGEQQPHISSAGNKVTDYGNKEKILEQQTDFFQSSHARTGDFGVA